MKVKEITTWNTDRRGNNHFSIRELNETNFSDDKACVLEYFLCDEKHVFADMFNIEYMGILTGSVNCSKEDLIKHINEWLCSHI